MKAGRQAAPAAPAVARSRLAHFDGLRGAAAFVVLIHHALLVLPWANVGYFTPDASLSGPAWLLTFTPLHLLWAGSEAVLLFFVLSGAVLVLPVLDSTRATSWLRYYPSRLARLYLPVAGAVALSVVAVVLFPRAAEPGASTWMAKHDVPLTASSVLHDLVLVRGTGWMNSALWSLRWEVVFSLLLPLYVVAVRTPRRALFCAVPYLVVLAVIGARSPSTWKFYLLAFAAGSLLIQLVRTAGPRTLGAAGGSLLSAFAVVMLTWRWWTLGAGLDTLTRFWATAAVLGSAALLLVVAWWPPAHRCVTSRPLLWLGTISFSLYLVHEPVVVSAATVLPTHLAWLAVVVGITVALPLAYLFHRLVEVPAHRLSQRIRRGPAVDRHRAAEPATAAAPATLAVDAVP